MNTYLTKKYWSPYLAGAGIGILSLITVYYMNHFLGSSGAFSNLALILNEFLFGGKAKAFINWQFIFVISIFFGALTASKLSGARQTLLPTIWTNRFGNKRTTRYIVAFFGGILVLFGARIAGGCTSGHGISGGLQLALSSWYFLLVLFASSMITAFIMYKK